MKLFKKFPIHLQHNANSPDAVCHPKYKLNINFSFKFSITIPYRNLSALYKYFFKFISFVSNSWLNVFSYLLSVENENVWELWYQNFFTFIVSWYNYVNFLIDYTAEKNDAFSLGKSRMEFHGIWNYEFIVYVKQGWWFSNWINRNLFEKKKNLIYQRNESLI